MAERRASTRNPRPLLLGLSSHLPLSYSECGYTKSWTPPPIRCQTLSPDIRGTAVPPPPLSGYYPPAPSHCHYPVRLPEKCRWASISPADDGFACNIGYMVSIRYCFFFACICDPAVIHKHQAVCYRRSPGAVNRTNRLSMQFFSCKPPQYYGFFISSFFFRKSGHRCL